MDSETKKILEDHEKRIKKLESVVNPGEGKKISKKTEQNFKGLSGGINFLIKNGYLSQLKSADEIWNELKREGYNYPKTSVNKILNVNFVNKKKVLNRLKENNIWRYAIRK